MTEPSDPIRIPIGRNITYAVRGMPEVPNAYGTGFLIPTEVSLTYRASEDSQLGRFHAYVKGQWRRDGEVVPSGEKLPGQHYYGDPSTWPAWLAEEARLHDPEPAVLSEAERTMLTYALDQAQEQIWVGDGFTADDQAALDSLRRLAGEAQQDERPRCPHCQLPHDLAPGMALTCASIRASIANADQLHAEGDHSRCAAVACEVVQGRHKAQQGPTQDGERRCPRDGEDLPDYADDDLVYLKGDKRPYCSMECVIATHRAQLKARSGQPETD